MTEQIRPSDALDDGIGEAGILPLLTILANVAGAAAALAGGLLGLRGRMGEGSAS